MEPEGKSVLTSKVTTFQSEFKKAPMEEDDPNESGEKLNDSVNSTLASKPDFKEVLANIKSVSSSQEMKFPKAKGTGLNILFARYYKPLKKMLNHHKIFCLPKIDFYCLKSLELSSVQAKDIKAKFLKLVVGSSLFLSHFL